MKEFPILVVVLILSVWVGVSGNLATTHKVLSASTQSYDWDVLAGKVLPAEGVVLPVVYDDIGPKVIASGAIDLEKFKAIYKNNPLSEQQLKVLTQGSNEKIVMSPDNAHFLLNLFWAFGLANKNPILEEGPMMEYGGREGAGGFASTGGWTVGSKDAMKVYSNVRIVSLIPEQQKIVEEVTNGVYRPCCDNPTSFPDCNHGMAALGLAELMASQGASSDEIFEALKVANSYWFASQYITLARYFEAKEGKSWDKVSGRVVLGKAYSSYSGWARVQTWLSENNLLPPPSSGGGSCGV